VRMIKTVAVYCGSNFGVSPAFADGARALGQELARANTKLVYGGTKNGLMGVLCDAVLKNGGTVHGVVTADLHQMGRTHPGLTTHEVSDTLRSRKERMATIADAFIALPGGIGTLDELVEIWSMNQMAELDKPIGLLNCEGFYTPFLEFIDHMVATKFLPSAHRDGTCVDDDPGALIQKLRRHLRVVVPKAL
jgi:uncharacterized protein (TIGR00730 family)